MSIQDFIADNFGAEYVDKTNVPADCIACGKEGHLYVNVETGLAYCFKCGYSANLYKLVRDLKGTSRFETMKLVQEIRREAGKRPRRAELKSVSEWLERLRRAMDSSDVVDSAENNALTLPQECAPAQSVDFAAEYLESRGLTKKFYAPYGVLACLDENSQWFGHLIIPDYDLSGALIYFTSRRCDNVIEDGRKSLHPEVAQPSGSLFGESRLLISNVDHKRVFVVEGPLDMLALSRSSICLLGKRLSTDKVRALAERFDEVVISLDSDAQVDAMKHAKLLRSSGVINVRVVCDLSGDPCEWVRRSPKQTVIYVEKHAEPYSEGGYLRGLFSG